MSKLELTIACGRYDRTQALIDGSPLVVNNSRWGNFRTWRTRRWWHRPGPTAVALLGDAAHTAHFSVGSGTKMAMEDAVALAQAVSGHEGEVSSALQLYQENREIEALKLQSAARNRMEWFEQVERYVHLDPEQFTYSLLTGSQRIGHENLKLRDAGYVHAALLVRRTRCEQLPVEPERQMDRPSAAPPRQLA